MTKITKKTAFKYDGWSWDAILAALREKGYTLKTFEQAYRLGSRSASQTRYKRHPRVDKALARCVGVPVWEIFPQRYDVSGQPIRGGRVNDIPLEKDVIEAINKSARRRNARTVVEALCQLEPIAIDFQIVTEAKQLDRSQFNLIGF